MAQSGSAAAKQHWVHVPTPGDHYSPATGSAIMTIIYELSRRHQAYGGATDVLVSQGTRHDYPVGRCIEVAPSSLPTSRQKLLDTGLGLLGQRRAFGEAAYSPACKALPENFDGTIFLWNSPHAVPLFRRRHPQAFLCLYAQNELFRTYGRSELRRVIAAADRVICCSQFLANDLRRQLGECGTKISGLVNGVDTDRFRPEPARRTPGPPVVLFIGRVVPQKGPDLLLRAAAKLRHSGRDFRVRIVGSSGFDANAPLTPYEQELRKLAEPIADVVEFEPFVDRTRVLDEYQAASIFCAPSNWDEPCSLTVPEALACGLPVVASRRGGIPEVGEQAVLYFTPPGVDELACHLACLLDRPDVRTQWEHQARARAESIDWANQYRSLSQLLFA